MLCVTFIYKHHGCIIYPKIISHAQSEHNPLKRVWWIVILTLDIDFDNDNDFDNDIDFFRYFLLSVTSSSTLYLHNSCISCFTATHLVRSTGTTASWMKATSLRILKPRYQMCCQVSVFYNLAHGTQVTKAVKQLKANHRLILSGTPVQVCVCSVIGKPG